MGQRWAGRCGAMSGNWGMTVGGRPRGVPVKQQGGERDWRGERLGEDGALMEGGLKQGGKLRQGGRIVEPAGKMTRGQGGGTHPMLTAE